MIDFRLDNLVERRNDTSDIITYRTYLNGKCYVMSYDKDKLKEVYFVRQFKNYFMSCRNDMQTISHYYIDKTDPNNKVMRRYENGKLNRIYKVITNRYITCTVDGQERIYISKTEDVSNLDPVKFQNDLTEFLTQFNTLKLYNEFSPNEPKKS